MPLLFCMRRDCSRCERSYIEVRIVEAVNCVVRVNVRRVLVKKFCSVISYLVSVG